MSDSDSENEAKSREMTEREVILERVKVLHRPIHQFIWDWSHERLTFSVDAQMVERREYYELFPIVKAIPPSQFCSSICLKWKKIIQTSQYSYNFSLGLLSKTRYKYDYNLINHIGRCEDSMGIICTKSSDALKGSLELWQNERILKTIPEFSLNNGDMLTVIFHPAIYDDEINFDRIWAHFLMNRDYLCGDALIMSEDQDEISFGVIPSPNDCFEIVEKDISRELTGLIERNLPKESDIISIESAEALLGDFDQKTEEKKQEDRIGRDQSSLPALNPLASECAPSDPRRPDPPVPSFFPSKNSLPLSQIQWNRPKSVAAHERKVKEEPVKDEIDSLYCCICLSSPKCMLLLPCKHLCLCEDCGSEKSGSDPILYCPICRKKIQHRMKVFL